MTFTEQDIHHLEAAQAWLVLSNHMEANEELENITPQMRGHPDVLRLRWEIYSRARKWDYAAEVANSLSILRPDDSFGAIHLAFALHEMKQTRQAWHTLLPIVDKFPDQWLIPYNMACYACQLGDMELAEEWFNKAMQIDKDTVRRAAIGDPDLAPLFKSRK